MSGDQKRPSRLARPGAGAGPRRVRRIAGQSPQPVRPTSESAKPKPDTAKAPQLLERARTTRVLGVLVGVLAVVVAALGATALWGEPDDDDVTLWQPVMAAGKFVAPSDDEYPVTVGPLEWRASVDEVAKAITKVFTFSWENIDTHAEQVAPHMTQRFLDTEYYETVAETAGRVKANKADYQLVIVGQSVITATRDRVEALIFANQVVTQGSGKSAKSDVYPLRLNVTAVREDGRWKIDEFAAG